MDNMLGEFLRKKRGDTSLRDFAKKLDISHTYLDNIEKGYDNRTKKPLRITVDTLSKIAKALDEPVEKLVALSENRDCTRLQIDDLDIAFASGIKGLNKQNQETLRSIMEGLLAKQEIENEKKEEK